MKNVPNCSNRTEYNYSRSLLLTKLVLPHPNLEYPTNYPKIEKKLILKVLTNLKLKSEVQVKADDWVLIKIRFSNQPASHLHPHPQPASQPPGKVSKKQDRAILPK